MVLPVSVPLLLSDDRVLAIEPMVDVASLVNLVDDPVSILLHTRGEDDDLVELRQLREKLHAVWPNQEVGVGAVDDVVDQRLVQVED